jgi:type IV pilus assembly protein PilX
MTTLSHASRRAPRHSQHGVSLFIALIALVALSFAGLALIRSVDTSNLIAGNLAFRQGALHASDIAIETAFNALATIPKEADSCCASGSNMYYATKRATDARGMPYATATTVSPPTAINWNNVAFFTTAQGYQVRYVIDRWCVGNLPITDIAGSCSIDQAITSGSKKAGAPVFTSSNLVAYRITVHVTGPRNNVSIVQSIVMR